jgi:C1A family cysteine protease
MAQSSSSAHWQKKGFGWIPDLPDITDPSLTLALDNKTRILSREGTEHLENIVNNLAKLLREINPDSTKQLEAIFKQFLGDTSFPNVQVYKILRKSEQLSNKNILQLEQSQAKETIQLKQVLYWMYREFDIRKIGEFENASNLNKNAFEHSEELFPNDVNKLVEWLQDPTFDASLEKIVKDFQRKHSLVEDGIVGLRTYTAIKTKLANPKRSFKEKNVELLCPSSIIPHDILGEVFQQLTYIWLCAKFDRSIERTFEYFHGQYPLAANQSKHAARIEVELSSIIHENLKVISTSFRDAIKLIPATESERKATLSESIQALVANLTSLKGILISKSRELTIATYQSLDDDFKNYQADEINLGSSEQKPASFPVRPIFEELHQLLSRSLADLLNTLDNGNSSKSILNDSFIIQSGEDFIQQFHMWFHIIEPFISAIFQILSPLASYDNYRQAVSSGFEKLDSCFQLYKLEYASNVANYKSLFLEYSSEKTSDQVEELQELRKVIVVLFEETIVKIDRIWDENLNYRPYFLASLEMLLKKEIDRYFRISPKRESLPKRWQRFSNTVPKAWLNKILQDLPKVLNVHDDEQSQRIHSLATLFVGPRLYTLAGNLLKSNLNEEVESYKKFIKDELSEDSKNVELYSSFFRFIREIISEKYNIRLKSPASDLAPGSPVNPTPTDIYSEEDLDLAVDEEALTGIKDEYYANGKKNETDAELVSFLTSKKELFEIQSIDSRIAGAAQVVSKESKALFFEPTIVQLPINANMMQKATKHVEGKGLSEVNAQTVPDYTQNPTKFYFFLPGLVDLSYWCPPIEDQEDINACTAFAGVSLLEYFAQKRYGKYTNLSARFLYKTARNLMNRSDDTGASVRQTMKALVLFGVPPEEVWPWRTEDFNEEPPAFCYAYAQSYQALKYFRLDAASGGAKDTSISSRELLLFQIKAVLAAGLPCIFGFTVYSSFLKDRNIRLGHIPYPSSRDQVMGGHAAVAVGYNDYKSIDRMDGEPTKPGAILIRNSWGPSWGNGGYGWIPYEYILEGLTADWWSLLKSEWFDGGAFGLGAVDPGVNSRPTK